jgi:DNA repair protein RadC
MKKNNNEAVISHLLSFCDRDAERIANELFCAFGDVNSVVEADGYVITQTCGSSRAAEIISIATALNGRRITDKYKIGKRYSEEEIKTYVCGLLLGATVETVVAVFMSDGKFLGSEIISEGTINSSEILPRRICDFAVRKAADKVIVAHNHPQGTAEPSVQDIAVSSELCLNLRNTGVSLVGAFVVSGFDVFDCLKSTE